MNKPQEIFEHSYTCVFNNNYHFVTTIRKDVNNRVTGANIDINIYLNSVGRLTVNSKRNQIIHVYAFFYFCCDLNLCKFHLCLD